MARQTSNARQVPSGRNSSNGAAVLDRPDIHDSARHDDDRLQQEILRVVQAALDGRLTERGRADQFEGNNRKVVEGVNQMLDALIAPLNLASNYVDLISKGDIPAKITDDCNGDFNTLKNNMNGCIDSLGGLSEAAVVLQKMAINDYRTVVEGKYQGVFASVAESVNLVHRRMTHVVDTLKNVSRGDLQDLPEYQKIGRRSEGDELVPAFVAMMGNIHSLIDDTTLLSKAAADGEFATRADARGHQGDFRKAIEGVNATLDVVVDKLNWYQSIIDSVPFPIHVIDKDMKWVFLNKQFEKLMVDNGVVRSRADAPGMPCSSAGASICKTDRCGLVQLGKGVSETHFDWNGQNCKQSSSKLTNLKGEHIGFVETVTDLTAIVRAKDYTNREVVRMASNLLQISKGNLDVDMKVAEADEFTRDIRDQFAKINDSVTGVVEAIRSLTADSSSLTAAAVAGKLDVRADVAKHEGDYRKVVKASTRCSTPSWCRSARAIESLRLSAAEICVRRSKLPARVTTPK